MEQPSTEPRPDADRRRVAIVTGGVRGIGRAIGLDLAASGWDIATCYRTSEADGYRFAEEAEALGARAVVGRADVGDPVACQDFVEAVHAELGGVDALVHAAGPYHRVPLFSESIAGWNEMFDGNLHPLFYLSRLVADDMRERGWGRILTFGMAGADVPRAQPEVTAHFIAKTGVILLTRTLAKLLGPHGVTANAISPGFIDSGSESADDFSRFIDQIPAGYVGTLDDAVAVARFLLSDEARYVNGANIPVSGGWGV